MAKKPRAKPRISIKYLRLNLQKTGELYSRIKEANIAVLDRLIWAGEYRAALIQARQVLTGIIKGDNGTAERIYDRIIFCLRGANMLKEAHVFSNRIAEQAYEAGCERLCKKYEALRKEIKNEYAAQERARARMAGDISALEKLI
jgi:hypothetical protein